MLQSSVNISILASLDTCETHCTFNESYLAIDNLTTWTPIVDLNPSCKFTLPGVFHNPGERMSTDTKFTDAKCVKNFGFGAMVPAEMIQFILDSCVLAR